MPIILVTTTTKPEGVKWFGETTPENAEIANKIREWQDTLPGLTRMGNEFITDDIRVQRIRFETVEDYAHYTNESIKNPYWVARKKYSLLNGITADAVEEFV